MYFHGPVDTSGMRMWMRGATQQTVGLSSLLYTLTTACPGIYLFVPRRRRRRRRAVAPHTSSAGAWPATSSSHSRSRTCFQKLDLSVGLELWTLESWSLTWSTETVSAIQVFSTEVPYCEDSLSTECFDEVQTFRRHILDVSPINMCECWMVKMTVNPEQMLALIAEETDARAARL